MAIGEKRVKKLDFSVTQQASLYKVADIRKRAQESILSGAVTQDYSLDLDTVYQIMNETLATEILCVLRYRHHQIVARGIHFPEIAREFKKHAENEEEHMLMIAERINQLGGNPDFNPATISQRTATEYGHTGQTNVITLIKEDLVAERVVIEIYRRVIDFFGNHDPTSRRLFEKILRDEEEHANDLADLLTSSRLLKGEDSHSEPTAEG